MFAQAYRLDRATFTHAYKHGRRLHMPGFVLIYAAAQAYACAAVVGKKVAQSAVARNTLRRRLYEALFEAGADTGHIIVIAKPTARGYSYARLLAEVTEALRQARRVGVMAHSR